MTKVLDADTNGALTLLLRYPPLPPSSAVTPADLVLDGRGLTDRESAANLTERYTARRPRPFTPPQPRPATPTAPVGRARSPFASPAALEGLISEAARGVLHTGERWGVNRAVRDVVRNIQHATAAAPPRYESPRRRQSARSETHGAIAASVLRRMNALEERNKRLAGMLDEGVRELWGVYEGLGDAAGADGEAGESRAADEDVLGRMGRAVAKVHFVQAFLKDMTLPLPEEGADGSGDGAKEGARDAGQTWRGTAAEEAGQVKSGLQTPSRSRADEAATPTRKGFERLPSPPRRSSLSQSRGGTRPTPPDDVLATSLPTSLSTPGLAPPSDVVLGTSLPILLPTPVPNKPSSPTRRVEARSESPAAVTPTKSRRPLAESSLSWLVNDESPAFARATSYTPSERRKQAEATRVKGKAYLFGEDAASSDGGLSGAEEGAVRGRRGSRRDHDGGEDEGRGEEIRLGEMN